MLQLNEATFASEVLEGKGPALVEFWAPWCGDCRRIGPVFQKTAEALEGKLLIGQVNLDGEKALGEAFEVKAIPTFLFFRGRAAGRAAGRAGVEGRAGRLAEAPAGRITAGKPN